MLDTIAGVFNAAAQQVTSLYSSRLDTQAGSFAVTVQSAETRLARLLGTTSDAFTLIGFSADLAYSGAMGTGYIYYDGTTWVPLAQYPKYWTGSAWLDITKPPVTY